MKKRRLFLACLISKSLQTKIANWQKRHHDWEIRWPDPKYLHITIVAPWWEKKTRTILKILAELKVDVKPFTIRFSEISFGPNTRRPRLIWMTGKTPLAILRLKKELIKTLRQRKEKRPFNLHLTIGRFINKKKLRIIPVKDNFFEKINWPDKISAFSLMESHLKPARAVYEELKRINL